MFDEDCLSVTESFCADCFSFVHFNVRGFLSHVAELVEVLRVLGFPGLVGLSETFLDESIEHVTIPEYELISRRDRDSFGGGIALFAHKSVAPHVVHVANSESHELSWHIFHSDQGPVCVCLWYRPPNRGEVASIECFDNELSNFSADCVFTVVMGDMNVHNIEWLKHSSVNSAEGRELHDVSCCHGLHQYVKEPTREGYLLDRVLADCDDLLKVQVIPGLSDHRGILGSLELTAPQAVEIERECFDFKKADWDALRKAFADTGWDTIFPAEFGGSFEEASPDVVDDAARALSDHIMRMVRRHVPHRKIMVAKSSHPWLDGRCRRAIREKFCAFGTASFASKRDACTAVLREAFLAYAAKTRTELSTMKVSSKQWWSRAKQLMMKGSGVSSIPPLRREDGSWARDGASKADVLSDTFVRKSTLPDLSENEYTPATIDINSLDDPPVTVDDNIVLSVLGKLREASGTGPDAIAARILKRCRSELLPAISRLCAGIVAVGHWPATWRAHWIHPIHKRKSKADGGNYRGVHLTSQLSKVCERVVVTILQPWLEQGDRQFAYTKGRGHRDALLFNIMQWLLWLEDGDHIALYCSDVYGAFDRVCKELLLRKICALRPPRCLAKLLRSWLDDRVSNVVVDGVFSKEMPLTDSVFQGTVLGPPLWNQHFADAKSAVRKHGFIETVYADDMNAFKRILRQTPFHGAQAELRQCQSELHLWGDGNRVTFDSGKESFHVIHRLGVERSNFKILGVKFDNQLAMHSAVRELAVQGGWRLRALLRARRFFSLTQLVLLYKSLVVSYLESGYVAFIHAPPTTMAPVDRIQRRFLREIGLTEFDALERFNLAPLEARRHMAALGVLHKRVLGFLPAAIAEMLPFGPESRTVHRTRLLSSRHDHQLCDPIRGVETQIFKRSIFGYIAIYNRLPQHVVETKTVKGFQHVLQNALRQCARRDSANWTQMYSYRSRTLDIARFQRYFVV